MDEHDSDIDCVLKLTEKWIDDIYGHIEIRGIKIGAGQILAEMYPEMFSEAICEYLEVEKNGR